MYQQVVHLLELHYHVKYARNQQISAILSVHSILLIAIAQLAIGNVNIVLQHQPTA